MAFLLFHIQTGEVLELRQHHGVDTVQEMLSMVYGDAIPDDIGCIVIDGQEFPQGQIVRNGELVTLPTEAAM